MGDPNIHKLLQKNIDSTLFDREVEKLCQERLRRLRPLLKQIDIDGLIQKAPNLKWLDLGCNDATILLALKRQYPSLELFGLEHRYDEYTHTYEFLQEYAAFTFTVKGGSWHDAVYPRDHFDIVSSIHAWPCPQNYLNREDEIKQVQESGKPYQDVLFDKDFSLNELQRFMEFVKPGGYLIIKTWQTPLARKKKTLKESLGFKQGQESYNIVERDVTPFGDIIYLSGIYLILEKRG